MNEARLPYEQRRHGVKSPGGKRERALRRAGTLFHLAVLLDPKTGIKTPVDGTYRK